ncbi:hypothetical protein [Xanthomonas bonasiae]|uniref:hypothetical protein n=1 Tax=Xanthomonas bonasiae TaxID=2810351 RepID=UPI00197F73BE|nr:hypothetical protein [Xanthomonas bonasiae]MBN6111420.1 hypothetical protein [Xanthomonas bonasiae]
MAKTMGIYCKAYLLAQLRGYSKWEEKAEAVRPAPASGSATAVPRALTDADIVYVQENYVVTDDVYKDEYVLFDAVDADWIAFCEQQLGFAVPAEVLEAAQAYGA